MKYHSVIIYKKDKHGELIEKEVFNFLDNNIAKTSYRYIVCEFSKKTKIPIKYSNSVIIGEFVVKLITNIPIIYYNINNCGEVVKSSFNELEIIKSINEMNFLGEKCYLEQYP